MSSSKESASLSLVSFFASVAAVIGSGPARAMEAPEALVQTVVVAVERAPDFSASASGGLTVTHDNDLFAHQGTDRDYTGGIHVSLPNGHNARATRWGFRALRRVDDAVRFSKGGTKTNSQPANMLRVGLLVFTPDEIGRHDPIYDDRPYANLVYTEFSQLLVGSSQQTVNHSSLTIGLLGSGIAEALQATIHRSRGLTVPQGFRHQISDGGELTARYARGRYRLVMNSRSHDLTVGYQAGIGYTTDATVGLNFRIGRRISPWWTALSDFGDRADRAAPARRFDSRGRGDFYVSGGIGLRLQAYNALLQGQWRHSDVTVDSSSLNRLLLDAWFGATTHVGRLRLEYKLRFRSAEIKHGPHSRDQLWGSLTVSRAF